MRAAAAGLRRGPGAGRRPGPRVGPWVPAPDQGAASDSAARSGAPSAGCRRAVWPRRGAEPECGALIGGAAAGRPPEPGRLFGPEPGYGRGAARLGRPGRRSRGRGAASARGPVSGGDRSRNAGPHRDGGPGRAGPGGPGRPARNTVTPAGRPATRSPPGRLSAGRGIGGRLAGRGQDRRRPSDAPVTIAAARLAFRVVAGRSRRLAHGEAWRGAVTRPGSGARNRAAASLLPSRSDITRGHGRPPGLPRVPG